MNNKEFEAQNCFGKGEENTAYAKYFIGKSYLNPLTSAGVKPFFANVTFEPGCRNNCTFTGRAAAADSSFCALRAAAGTRSGARRREASIRATWWRSPRTSSTGTAQKKDCWFSHIAVELIGEDTANEWLEAVSDETYDALNA